MKIKKSKGPGTEFYTIFYSFIIRVETNDRDETEIYHSSRI